MRPLIALAAWLLLLYSSLLPMRGQEVVASISVGQGAGTLVGVAVDPGSNTIFCGAYGGIFALDGSDDSYEYPPSGTWGSYPFATGVAVNPSTGRVYIAESYPPNSFYSLQVLDEATGNNLAGIVLGSNPNALAVNASANMVYVATATGIVVVDGSTDLQVTTIPVLNATGVAADSTRGKLYAVYQNGATFSLAVVDATSNTVISTVALRSGAYGIAVNPVTNRLYITLSTAGGVQVLEGVGYTEIAYSGTGAEPEAVAVNTVTNTIYIANLAGQTVTILDGSTNLGQYTLSVPSPWAIAVNEATNLIYVAGGNTSTFTVIDGAAVQPASLTFTNLDQVYSAGLLSATLVTDPANIATTVNYSANGLNYGNAVSGVGSYTVTASVVDPRYSGSATATFTIEPQALPVITMQPASQVVLEGGQATFSVTATANEPLFFTWNLNGSPIGSNDSYGPTYTIDNVQPSQAGSYSVTVENQTQGSVTSAPATLTVNIPGLPPSLTTEPSNVTVTAGSSATLVAVASGTSPFSYQWYQNGSAVPGATSPILLFTSTSASDTGTYSVTVANSAGMVTSSTATLTVEPAVSGAPSITTNPMAQMVASGSTVVFRCDGSTPASSDGNTLQPNASDSIAYQWSFNGVALVDGPSGSTIFSGSSSPTLLVTNPSQSGTYICTVINQEGAAMSLPASLTVSNSVADPGRIINLSCRAFAGTGADAMIAGFVVEGSAQSLPVLIRASGPAIAAAPFDVPGVLSDPELQLHATVNGADSVLATDAGWAGNPAIASTAAQVGAFSWGAGATPDSALLETLQAGSYTGIVSGAAGGTGDTGVALVEIFDATPTGTYSPGQSSRLENISARTEVGTGANVTIAGFVVGGQTSKTVLVRASGPALAAAPFNLSGILPNPKLELHQTVNGTDQIIASNTGWGGDAEVASVARSVGAFSWGTSPTPDSAILITLPPGAYTAIVSGAAGAGSNEGIALLEVYDVP